MSTDQTPALSRATEANYATHHEHVQALHGGGDHGLRDLPEWVQECWAANTRAAVSAALHDHDDDVIARTLRDHGEVVVHSRLGCRCGWRLPPGWMGVDGARDAQSRHVADAVRAAILGSEVA